MAVWVEDLAAASWDVEDDGWRPPKIALVRWKRAGDGWQRHAHFNLTDAAQLDALADLISITRDRTSA